jgi:Pyruvate/2-oxoacid:ferredoxin oxidoreductase gamma subunit
VANTVALGILVAHKRGLIKEKTIIDILEETFKAKIEMLKQNRAAFERGLRLGPRNERLT